MNSPFERSAIPARIAFVSDFWPTDLVGGAELTLEALADEVGQALPVSKHRARDLTHSLVDRAPPSTLWVLGNCATANPSVLQYIASGWRFVVVEFDYKICAHRSMEKHAAVAGKPCDCAATPHGRFVQKLFDSAEAVLWMSEAQRAAWTGVCQLHRTKSNVISSQFSPSQLASLTKLAAARQPSDEWAVLESDSWVKGTQAAREAAQAAGRRVKPLRGLPPTQLLEQLSTCAGLVYKPLGADTCPRLVIEAAALGLELDCNDRVQHASEPWAALRGAALIEHLNAARVSAASLISDIAQRQRTLSGYVTTLNCLRGSYPISECVSSLLGFCDEVVVLDGGSSDGTIAHLERSFPSEPRLILRQHVVDLSAPDFALEDGRQKARARALCTSDLCWQQDADEIVEERDFEAIRRLANAMRGETVAVSLPVVEFWGGAGLPSQERPVRIDVTPWKWRLSINSPTVTHGVPRQCEKLKPDGTLAVVGSDGCDLIYATTREPVPHACYHGLSQEALRQRALAGDSVALREYEAQVNAVCARLPVVWHYSWLDLKRKIELYQQYWTQHWSSLAGMSLENHMFPGCDPSDVTPEMVRSLALRLANAGGWIWHAPWDGGSRPTIRIRRRAPL